MSFDSFFSDILSGIVLTFVFFFFKEKIFPRPQIDGRWYFQMETIETAYNPYNGMKLFYVAFLFQEGDKILGTVEKIYESSSKRTTELTGTERIRGTIQGRLEKNYLEPDKMQLHIIENGKSRESSHYFELSDVTANSMTGKFFSTIADQTGLIKWQRQSFQPF